MVRPVSGPTDPRLPGGDIAGPGGPYDNDGVIVDATKAVLTDNQVSLIKVGREGEWGEKAMALLLEGRINKTEERAKILFLVGPDGAAALVSEIVAMCGREGSTFAAEFQVAFEERMKAMP